MNLEDYFWAVANAETSDEVCDLRFKICLNQGTNLLMDGGNLMEWWLRMSALRAVTLGSKNYSGTVASRTKELMDLVATTIKKGG